MIFDLRVFAAIAVVGVACLYFVATKKRRQQQKQHAETVLRQKKQRRTNPKKVLTKRTGDRYLVIGGTGMLGSHIVEGLLARGENQVVVFDRRATDLFKNTPGVTLIEGDITNKDQVREVCKGVDTVICTAAVINYYSNLSWDYQPSYDVNVQGTFNVVDACVEAGVKRLIYTSSNTVCAQYDPKTKLMVETGHDETAPFAQEPFHCHYMQTKIAGEKIALGGNGKGKLLVTVMRPSGMWGPRDGLLTEVFLEKLAQLIGNPKCCQDYAYVENVVHGFLCAEASLRSEYPVAAGKAYNIGNGYVVNYLDWNQKMSKEFGCDIEILPVKVADTLAAVSSFLSWLLQHRFTSQLRMLTPASLAIARATLIYSCDRARRDLNWEPPYTTEEAIRITAQYYHDGAKN